MVSNKTSNRRAVSPIVAVLILIVVAVVGGGAVAVLMGQIGSDTAKQASSSGTADKSSQILTIGGSTTVFPMTEALKPVFTQKTGIAITDEQGGSGAGMVGVDQGVLDIGATSSIQKYNDAVKAHPNDDLRSFEVAGSGLVVITSGAGFLTDGAAPCYAITKAALVKLYTQGSMAPLAAGACTDHIIQVADVGAAGAVVAYHRSDPGGTEEAMFKYLGLTSLTGTGADGNPGVFTAVSNAAVGTSIGFVDIGFAKDNTSQKALTNIMGVLDSDTGTLNNAIAVTKGNLVTAADGTLTGISATDLTSAIKNALKNTGAPDTGKHYPLDASGIVGLSDNTLARAMFYVTKGAPSATEQQFIDFARSTDTNSQGTGVVDLIHSVGYYSYSEYKN